MVVRNKSTMVSCSTMPTRACLLVLAIAAWSVNLFLSKSLKAAQEPCDHDMFLLPNAHGVEPGSLKFQAFVISSQLEKAKLFHKRNRESLPGNFGHNTTSSPNATNVTIDVAWFPASNGFDQLILNQYASLTGYHSNVTDFTPENRRYEHPHHTGCFMSHWNLLRLALAGWKSIDARPDALFVFEDDATCATNLLQEILHIFPLLPTDDDGGWDLLFVGGKPFSYHVVQPIASELKEKNKTKPTEYSDSEFRRLECLGYFGKSDTGPFAPDGSRRLMLNQSYWTTRYITNTQSYIVNPKRVEKILNILEHPTSKVPVDIALANAGRRGDLKIIMTTRDFCSQGGEFDHGRIKDMPSPWEGYYHSDQLGYRWGEMIFPECPDKP